MTNKEHEIIESRRHPLFDTSLKRHRDTRMFSCFRTQEDGRITVWPHLKERAPYVWLRLVNVDMLRDEKTLVREELYNLYQDGRVKRAAKADVPAVTGGTDIMQQILSSGISYSAKDIFNERYSSIGGKSFPNPVKEKLDLIEGWLSDEQTVRVDPYDFERQLPDEDTEYDHQITKMAQLVEDFSHRLSGSK